jgi:hypothetical protein
MQPKYEGHWRMSCDAESHLPWPRPGRDWPDRVTFLRALDRVEADAERIAYRGFSHCRICECINGNEAFRLAEWEWPAGYRHYLVDHGVRPSEEFEAFIVGRKRS